MFKRICAALALFMSCAVAGQSDVRCAGVSTEMGALRHRYKPARFQGKAYREVGTPSGDAFELPESIAGARTVNAFARSWLEKQAASAHDCEMNGGGGWHAQLHPIVWTRELLVVEDALPDTYCGGAHGGSRFDYYTFELGTGRRLDPWSWIKGRRKAVDGGPSGADPPLRQLLKARYPRDDCREHVDAMYVAAPYPSKQGMAFNASFAHAIRACDDTIVVNYRALAPYLTPAGKAIAARMARQ